MKGLKDRKGRGAGKHQTHMDLDLIPNLKRACVCVCSWLCVSHAFWMSFLIWGQSSLQSGSTFSIYISGLSLICNPEGMGFLFSIGNTEDGQQSVRKNSKAFKRANKKKKRKTQNQIK